MLSQQVPERILKRLVFHINAVNQVNAEIERCRQLGQTVGSRGRYEWEYRTTNCPNLTGSFEFFDQFETVAGQNGIEPQAVYEEYGGKPELEPWSDEAQAWVRPE